MANVLIVSWSAVPFTKTASAFLSEDLKRVLSDHKVIVLGDGPDGHHENNSYFVSSELNYQGKGKRFLKPLRWSKLKKVKSVIDSVVIKEKITTVIAVFPEELFSYAAYLSAKKNKLTFIPYFHNTYLENRNGINLRIAKKIQPKLFSADKVLVTSDGLRKFYEKKYPNVSFDVLRHFLFEPILKTPLNSKTDKITFFFLGTINDSNLDATRFFCDTIKGHSTIHLNISSSVPQNILKRNGILNENVHYLGFVENLEDEYAKSDFMLLTHGFSGGFSDEEYETIFPTKTVEMLRSGKPIFALSPENSFLTDFIKERECALLTTVKDKNEVLEKIVNLKSNLDQKLLLIKNAQKTFELFNPKNAKEVLNKYIK